MMTSLEQQLKALTETNTTLSILEALRNVVEINGEHLNAHAIGRLLENLKHNNRLDLPPSVSQAITRRTVVAKLSPDDPYR